jgi:hypothetical protein
MAVTGKGADMEKVTVAVSCEVCSRNTIREVAWNRTHLVKHCSPRCASVASQRRVYARNRRPRITVEERLLRRLKRDPLTGCLEWQGSRGKGGYGLIRMSQPSDHLTVVHRVAFEIWVGPVPAGLELDHTCNNPPCCEPSHLEPVTHDENMRRMVERRNLV